MLTLEYALSDLARLLPFPQRKANKYSRGKLIVVGGSRAYPGAAGLAAMAAQEMGAGYVEVLCAPENADVIRCMRPSLVVRPWNEKAALNSLLAERDDADRPRGGRGSSDMSAPRPETGHPEAYLVGPGIAADDAYAFDLVSKILDHADAPVVIDGGALSAVATAQGARACSSRAERRCVTVMTPHMGEAARLAKQARIDVPSSHAADGSLARFAYALSQHYASAIILKGPTTYLSCPSSDEDEMYVVRQGTAALAKAGTGDVLAGIVGALFAQQTPSLTADHGKACALAATLHAFAGRLAAEKKTDISVCAEDVKDNIYGAIRYLLEFV